MHWKQKLIFVSSALLTVSSGFLIVMHFQDGPHWPAKRFGGTPGALALIPVCLLSYAIGCFYINRWLHPRVFPRMRAAFPAPAFQPPARADARSIALSTLAGMLSGGIAIVHFSQPRGADSSLLSTLAALLCALICFVSFSRCSLLVDRWLFARGTRPRDHIV